MITMEHLGSVVIMLGQLALLIILWGLLGVGLFWFADKVRTRGDEE